jgi:hypothetical protein
MADILLESVVTPCDDAIFREIGGEAVILNLMSGEYFGLDAVGTHIWRLLAEQRQVRAVLSLLVAEFDAPADRLERDLLDLVVRLAEKGLVTTAGPPA